MSMLRRALGAVFLLCLVGCSKGVTDPDIPEDDFFQEFDLSSDALAREFSADEAAAKAKYRGKVLAVTGKVDSVDGRNVYFVRPAGARARVVGAVAVKLYAEHLSPGRKVKLVGRCSDDSPSQSNVWLKACSRELLPLEITGIKGN